MYKKKLQKFILILKYQTFFPVYQSWLQRFISSFRQRVTREKSKKIKQNKTKNLYSPGSLSWLHPEELLKANLITSRIQEIIKNHFISFYEKRKSVKKVKNNLNKLSEEISCLETIFKSLSIASLCIAPFAIFIEYFFLDLIGIKKDDNVKSCGCE